MGFFGMFGKGSPSAAQQVARGGDGVDPSTMGPSPLQNFVGRLNNGMNAAMATLGNPAALQQIQQQNSILSQARLQGLEGQRQIQLAQYKAQNPEQPDVIRALAAAGIDPKSPQGQAIIANNYSHPIIMGSPEQGFQPIGGQFNLPGQGAPPPPKPGDVMDGHVYLGGDPASPASWRQQ